MNKVINIFSGITLAVYCAFVMAVVYDLSISSHSFKGIPFIIEICGGFALLILLLGTLRIKRKWQGASDMKRFKGFRFVRVIARPALNLSLVYAIAEAIFMLLLIYFLTNIAKLSLPTVLPMIVVIGILLTEAIIFAARIRQAGPSFRIGIDKKAVAYFNREMHIFYFTGLRRIELHQDMVNFQYKDDLNLLLPLEVLSKEDIVPFREALIETLEEYTNTTKGKIIYIDDAFRTLE